MNTSSLQQAAGSISSELKEETMDTKENWLQTIKDEPVSDDGLQTPLFVAVKSEREDDCLAVEENASAPSYPLPHGFDLGVSAPLDLEIKEEIPDYHCRNSDGQDTNKGESPIHQNVDESTPEASDTLIQETGSDSAKNVSAECTIGPQEVPAKKTLFSCEHCGALLLSMGDLEKHVVIHNADRTFPCRRCDEIFSVESELKKHMETHRGERAFCCQVCSKAFTRNSHLTKHMNIHTGYKRHTCSICEKGFYQHAHLIRHMLVHSGDKPFVCEICNKGFSQKTTLLTHTRSHTGERPYVCKDCNKGFAQKSDLDKHTRVHSGEKPFRCCECNKCFTQQHSLKNHMRVHTGQRPFICKECDKSFGDRSVFKKHLRMHARKSQISAATSSPSHS